MLKLLTVYWKQSFLLVVLLLRCSLSTNRTTDTIDYLLCRSCGYEVTKSSKLIWRPTSEALSQRNDSTLTLNTTLVQRFKNPAGVEFELVTASSANVWTDSASKATTEYSWFPGWAWNIVACPHCRVHLGWSFHEIDGSGNVDIEHSPSFYALILSKLLRENFADSLILSSKVFDM